MNCDPQSGNLADCFGSQIGQTITLGDLIGTGLSAAITIAGIIMVFLFIGGGLMMIVSAGNGNAQGAAQGKQAITWALVGFAIIFTAYWIIRILEIITGTPFLTDPNIFGGGNIICTNCLCPTTGSLCTGACTAGGCAPI